VYLLVDPDFCPPPLNIHEASRFVPTYRMDAPDRPNGQTDASLFMELDTSWTCGV